MRPNGGSDAEPDVGLDLGTSTMLVAAGSRVVWIGDAYPWMPSLVGYDADGWLVVGEEAEAAAPGQVIRSVKRAITQWRSVVRVDAPGGLRDVPADDMLVELLRRAVRRARAAGLDLSGVPVRLGCPALWDGRQRHRLLAVARRAGLAVTLAELVDEPVAAGIAWLAARPAPARRQRILVFDMGGGTLDIAVLTVDAAAHGRPGEEGPGRTGLSVLASVGAAEAGDTLDEAIADDLGHALRTAGVTVPRTHVARELLLDAARRLKTRLSTEVEDVVVLAPEVFGRNETWYTREQLDAAFTTQLDRAEEYVAAALRAARVAELPPGAVDELAGAPVHRLAADLDAVVLSGGMSRVPYVARRLRALLRPDTPVELATAQPETAVALGLAAAARYDRTNRYRPAFDIVVEWDLGRQSRTVYEAYRPLVESWQLVRGGPDLRFVRDGAELDLPSGATGQLRLIPRSAPAVRASLDGRELDGFPVELTGRFEFAIYPSGHLRMVDGAGAHGGRWVAG